MIKGELKPNKISDIVNRMDEYLSAMRAMEKDDVIEFVNFLENYIRDYFSNEKLDDLELRKTTVELVDCLYLKLMNLELRDIHTDGYFSIILNRLFWELAQKDILAFYIIDNKIRDDRFKLLIELFGTSHFTTVYPYSVEKIDHSEEYSKYPSRDYNEVEKQIDDSTQQKRHILYVEKDDSVNYLSKILELAEEFQSKYVCIFRNQASDSHKSATWLMGSFGDILKINETKIL